MFTLIYININYFKTILLYYNMKWNEIALLFQRHILKNEHFTGSSELTLIFLNFRYEFY